MHYYYDCKSALIIYCLCFNLKNLMSVVYDLVHKLSVKVLVHPLLDKTPFFYSVMYFL